MADSVTHAVMAVAGDLTPLLRNRAIEMGWPEDVANSLRIGEGFQPTWNPEDEEEILRHEFGDMTSAPKPALWTFTNDPESRQQQEVIAISRSGMILQQVIRLFQ